MAILKLGLGKQNAISGTVQSVTLDTAGKFGPQYKVELTTGDTIYLNKDPMDRQLQRLGKLPNELDGETVTFWKKADPNDANGIKGFLNIDLGNTARNASLAMRAMSDDNVTRDLRNHGVLPSKKDYDQIKTDFVACLGDAVAILRDAEETLGVPFTPAEYISVAHGLAIARQKAGV